MILFRVDAALLKWASRLVDAAHRFNITKLQIFHFLYRMALVVTLMPYHDRVLLAFWMLLLGLLEYRLAYRVGTAVGDLSLSIALRYVRLTMLLLTAVYLTVSVIEYWIGVYSINEAPHLFSSILRTVAVYCYLNDHKPKPRRKPKPAKLFTWFQPSVTN